jgi:TolB-like protein/cytochrome c-type biogenesis protein CcmH/NrfG
MTNAKQLELRLLGTPEIRTNGSPLNLGRKKSIALLAYLGVNDKSYTRDTLATLLWPERWDQQARGNLRRMLSELRKQLGKESLPVDGERVGPPNPSTMYVDTREFDELIGTSKSHKHEADTVCRVCLEQLTRAADLYRGDFMIGFSLGECAEFSDWQFFQAEYLRRELEYALRELVFMYSESPDYERAIEYARAWLALDTLNEPVHRQLMQLYTLNGERSAALRQYRICREVLQKELSLPPEEETERLFRTIKVQQLAASPRGSRRPDSARPRLAVLPLKGLTEEEAWFSEGMTDCMITALSEISGLQVISRTTAYNYQDTHKSARQIASELGVRFIVEGTVLRSGEEVRVSAQLIDAPADENLWARNFVRHFGEVMALQGEIAQTIADQVEVRLTSGERSRLSEAREVDPDVRELCMRGEHYLRSFDPKIALNSIPCYEQAINLVPGYSPAYSGLAHIYACLGSEGWSVIPAEEGYERARSLATHALELDENNLEAHMVMGLVKQEWDFDVSASEACYRRALAINPNHALTLAYRAQRLDNLGRWSEALESAEKAHHLDPFNGLISCTYCMCLIYSNKARRALAELERIDKLFPTFWNTEIYRAHIYIRMRQFDKVAEYLERGIARADPSEEADAVKGPLVAVYSFCDRKAKAERLMREVVELREQGRMPSTYMGIAAFGLGRQEEAIDWLEQAYEERDHCILDIKRYYIYEVLRGHPRVQNLMRRIGIPP